MLDNFVMLIVPQWGSYEEMKHQQQGEPPLDVCLSAHRCICVEKKNQLDATEWFIALIICSTCFEHFYAHHQQLETILCYYRLWCAMPWLLVVGRSAGYAFGMREVARLESSNIPHPERIAGCPAPDLQQPPTKHCTP